MIELYLDTVDTSQIRRLNAALPLRGITTNPSILAKANKGVNQVMAELEGIIDKPRLHVQVISQSVEDMVDEAILLSSLPFDIVVKIPATEAGIAAIKITAQKEISILATAIYSVQQGLFAALNGAEYLAPYVNRIDMMMGDGVKVVADLQDIITQHHLDCKLLPASFKNTRQVIDVIKLGVEAITLPPDIALQMFQHPAVAPAVDQFNQDWAAVFGDKLSFES
ncbi:MAG: fructose-6-phosphate aldolase [Methylococcales bacterium]|nr:fructose-6-phosphate aldolase [Methylococcales bacterium]